MTIINFQRRSCTGTYQTACKEVCIITLDSNRCCFSVIANNYIFKYIYFIIIVIGPNITTSATNQTSNRIIGIIFSYCFSGSISYTFTFNFRNIKMMICKVNRCGSYNFTANQSPRITCSMDFDLIAIFIYGDIYLIVSTISYKSTRCL